MIRGAIDDNVVVKDYKEEDIPHILEEFFKSLWKTQLSSYPVHGKTDASRSEGTCLVTIKFHCICKKYLFSEDNL